MIPSPQEATQQLPSDVAQLASTWNDRLNETLSAQPSMTFCADKLVLEAFAELFDRYGTQQIYLKNPEDSLVGPPTEMDRALVTLVNDALHQCRIPGYYTLHSDFYIYRDHAFTRIDDSNLIKIRTLISKLLGPEYYLNDLKRFWDANHSATQQPRRTFIAHAVALLIQCETSLRFEAALLKPASVALIRQLSSDAQPETLNLFQLSLQDTTHTDEMALVGAFAISTWPPGEHRTLNRTVLYLPGQRLAEFDSPTALKTHLTRLFNTAHGRQYLLACIAHRQYSAFESLAPRANQDALVNLIPVTAVENFFNHQADLLIARQRQDIEHHWAVSRNTQVDVIKTIDQAANLAPVLNFNEAIEQYARKLLTLNAQRREDAAAVQQRLIQLKTDRSIDFTGLLTQLKTLHAQAASQPLTQQFFTPHRQSPLHKACVRAVEVLQKLKNDTDFADWLSKRSSEPQNDWWPWTALEKLVNNMPAIVDSPQTRFTIQGLLLPLSEVPAYWYHDAHVLIAARRDVGDGIGEDGTVRLDLALKFYGVHIASASPPSLVIERLQERAAALSLDMDEGRLPFDDIIDEQEDARLQTRLDQRKLPDSPSIFAQLSEHFLTPDHEVLALKTPTVALEEWLNSRECIELGKQLVKVLGWYTTTDETPPVKVLRDLVWRTLWLHLERPTTGKAQLRVAGQEIATPLHWARSYSYIRQQIEASLVHNHRLTPGGVQLALRLLQQASTAEVWVKDIPDDLHYASSIAWVNFKAGVILAQAIAPDAAQHMTFQELLGLVATASENATPEQQIVLSLARLRPTLEWAIVNGVLTSEKTEFAPEQIQLAVEALEQQEQEIIQATETMSKAPPGRWRFDTDKEFDQGFSDYLSEVKAAYPTLIRALLPNLPPADRRAIENGQVKLYALRQELRDLQVQQENAEDIAAVRGRQGFIIQAQQGQSTTYYEVFPRAAIIRARPDIKALKINGDVVVRNTGSSHRPSQGTFRLATSMPFDWEAYQHGRRPRDGVSSQVIAEQIGNVLPATAPTSSEYMRAAQSWSSVRSRELAAIVAKDLFHTNESQLKSAAKRNTSLLEIVNEVIDDFLVYAKMLVPFWGAVEDLASGDPKRVERGGLSLFTDLISFGSPIGKYVGGSGRLIAQAGKISFQVALPKFATLTKTFLLGTLKELNPLEAVPSLLKLAALGFLRLSAATVRQVDAGLELLRKAFNKPTIVPTGRTLQSVDPQTWKPLKAQDSLFTVDDIDQVPMRSVGTDLLPEYRLIDPVTNTVFGPRYIPTEEAGLQRSPPLDDYIAPVTYEQTVEFTRRANGIYDGKNQQSYVRSRGQWYFIETRYSLTGDTEFYIVHPHNKTRPAHRIVNHKGGWTPVDEGGHAGGRLRKLREAKAKQAAHEGKVQENLNSATVLLDRATETNEFNLIGSQYDKSRLHKEAANELGLIHTKHFNSPVFKPEHFSTSRNAGRAQLIKAIEVADDLGPRYAAVIDSLEGYLEAQQKSIERLSGPGQVLEQNTPDARTFKPILVAKRRDINTVIEQTKVFKSILDDELEKMLGQLEIFPAQKTGPSPAPSQPGTSQTPPTNPLPPGAPNNSIPILIAGDKPRSTITLSATPRAGNSDVADVIDRQGQRIAFYKPGEDKLWIRSSIQIQAPTTTPAPIQADITRKLNIAAENMQDMVTEYNDLIGFYRSKPSSEPAGAESLIRSGATKLNQGADDLEAACSAITDEATRQSLIAQVQIFRENAARIKAMAKLVRRELISKQAPTGNALEFLHSQPGILRIHKTLNRVERPLQIQKPGTSRSVKVPDFLDEFEIKIGDNVWAYAHMHFEQASYTIPAKIHLHTPERRALSAPAQAEVARESRHLDMHRAEIYWPQARRVFYPEWKDD